MMYKKEKSVTETYGGVGFTKEFIKSVYNLDLLCP